MRWRSSYPQFWVRVLPEWWLGALRASAAAASAPDWRRPPGHDRGGVRDARALLTIVAALKCPQGIPMHYITPAGKRDLATSSTILCARCDPKAKV